MMEADGGSRMKSEKVAAAAAAAVEVEGLARREWEMLRSKMMEHTYYRPGETQMQRDRQTDRRRDAGLDAAGFASDVTGMMDAARRGLLQPSYSNPPPKACIGEVYEAVRK